MAIKTRIITTSNVNPYWNLALEEYLLDSIGTDECILYLWQNQNTVVIGKNQNPWKECSTEQLEKDGGYLARRLSGGGAVFHDMGNLNFTFLVDRKLYNLERQVGVLLKAVKKLGIAAEMSGRNDLTVEERKFSGNAFCFRKASAYHHGTLLVKADLDKLSKYLQVPENKIVSKGINSVRSRVTNLVEYNASLTIEKMAEALKEAFIEEYGGQKLLVENADEIDRAILKPLYDKYSAWEWNYGEAPKFDIDLSERFSWGGVEIGMKLEKSVVTEVHVYSDALDEEFIGLLPDVLRGTIFSSAPMAAAIRNLDVAETRKFMVEDIANWLEHTGF